VASEQISIVARAPGGPDVLTIDRRPLPAPEGDQVLIRVEAAGVNFIDIYQRTGLYPAPPPIALGLEGAGTVEAVGPKSSLSRGTRVAWAQVPGSYASHVLCSELAVVPVPREIDAQTAAAAMLQGLTAHYLMKSTFDIGPEHTCLVHAAAGGVGLLLCQLGRHLGARVIGTVSTPGKAQLARKAGATDVILYTQNDFLTEVKRLTKDEGVDVVYDSVGKTTFDKSLDCLRPRGLLVLFGQSSGPVPAFELQRLNKGGSLYITRPSLGHYIANRREYETRVKDLWTWIQNGALRIAIDSTFPLSRAAEAQTRLESRASSGKILLLAEGLSV
jgi:NADPH2:quinone reductase